jgi:hypothetical protein
MHLLDNINQLLGNDLKKSLQPKAKLQVAASCFSIYIFQTLKGEDFPNGSVKINIEKIFTLMSPSIEVKTI